MDTLDFLRMPKARNLSMKKDAVRARERREKDREDKQYNETLKEYVRIKHARIIDEFEPFYEGLKAKYPKGMVYINTKEFRRWRKDQIREGREQQHDEQPDEQEQHEQQQQRGEQHDEQGQHEQQQQDEHHDIWQQQQQVDDEINRMINELENGGVPLQNDDDEGIHLDIYEELQQDIEDFDYRLEVELGTW